MVEKRCSSILPVRTQLNDIVMEKWTSMLLILMGLFLLLYLNMPPVAGVCLLIGIVMTIEKKWPEEWKSEKK